MNLKSLMLLCAATMTASPSAQAAVQIVGKFDATTNTPPSPWRVIRFDEKIPATRYQVIVWDGVTSVEAIADASMSLLARPIEIDLKQTPILCWRWRVDAPLTNADMAKKSGDDYAARVYVSFKLPADTMSFGVRTKLRLARTIYGDNVPDAAINYVWDNRYPVGTRRPNAYTDRTQMVVLRSGAQEAGRWVTEKRDVMADAVQAFGTDRIQATSIAIAADTDNTGEKARSGFADLHFVARDVACSFQ